MIDGLLKRLSSEQSAIVGALASMFADADAKEMKAEDVGATIFTDLSKRKGNQPTFARVFSSSSSSFVVACSPCLPAQFFSS